MQGASPAPAKAPYGGGDMCVWGEGYVSPLFTQGLEVERWERTG